MGMKGIRTVFFLAVMAVSVWLGGVAADARALRQDIVRLHVVANSDAPEDQAVKLQVRDAVLDTLQEGMADLTDPEKALAYAQEMIPKLTRRCNEVLLQAGFDETVRITVGPGEFPLRMYDTFRLPSGVYQALKVVIGEGQGRNWWCVVFPELCAGATSAEFVETAKLEGMDEALAESLTGDYEIRFWVLDQLGKLENFLHRDSE
jgi:stage II sporulation protein R